jgi:hypothetical protein
MKIRPSGANAIAVGFDSPLTTGVSVKPEGITAAAPPSSKPMAASNSTINPVSTRRIAYLLMPTHQSYRNQTARVEIPTSTGSGAP